MDRVEGDWEDKDEVKFKTLFLLLSLHMVLCPSQSPRISPDMLPALACAKDYGEYDRCGLVLSKFVSSVTSFARKFYSRGYVGGSGGCLLFIVVCTLDYISGKILIVYGATMPFLKLLGRIVLLDMVILDLLECWMSRMVKDTRWTRGIAMDLLTQIQIPRRLMNCLLSFHHLSQGEGGLRMGLEIHGSSPSNYQVCVA
ncbi:uncharacterized protein LOC110734536 [Chenopodium quinoa]|uniref:uncharacterized protein LOC110734536 n=1 Tax=Chenopodium quinoa TaxID=63459 RepID=UPI000B7847A7|nr:uncharacterized protein LOC110734536 [Chenopodium quinoa]XP_021770399.1 uncharacterized protein LOC110734536 [Chenopodium quinoa]